MTNCSKCRRPTHNAAGVCTQCLNKGESTSVDDAGPCQACKEPTRERRLFRSNLYCNTCFEELKHGTIVNQNVTFFGGAGSSDDANPWQQNAIRHMEDRS